MEKIQWHRIIREFDRMGDFNQLRAVTKEQMQWLTEVGQKVPDKYALDWALVAVFPP